MYPVIVCCGTNGRAVLFGRVETLPTAGRPFTLIGARMVLRWSADCGGLLGLATQGPRGDTSITHAVPYHSDECARQVLGVTAVAAAAIDAWPPA